MRDSVLVEALQVGRPSPQGMPNPEDGQQPLWMDVSIFIRNRAKTTTYYVMTSLRQLRYDPTTDTLTLTLREPEAEVELGPLPRRTLPEFRRVAPGEAQVITVQIPAVINRITGIGPGPEIEVWDVSNVKTVECSIAYSPKPFSVPDRKYIGALEGLPTWGRSTGKKVALRGGPDRT